MLRFYIALYFSYKILDHVCHVPHDPASFRLTHIGLNEMAQSGYESFFLSDSSFPVPTLRQSASGVDTVYWLGGIEDDENNAISNNVYTAQDCYLLCMSRNNYRCWIFRYVDIFS